MAGDTSNADTSEIQPADPVDRAIEAFRRGEPVCVHDFDDREGETDVIYPASAVDTTAVTRMRNDAGGLICVGFSAAVADAAELPFFADAIDHPTSETEHLAYGDRSAFSLTVNHRDTFTGITDEDRALTIAELGAFAATVDDGERAGVETFAEQFRAPGHVHLLRAADGLLDERQGHTELGIALADAAGQPPAAVVCEMLDDETGMALSPAAAREYAARNGIPYVEGEALIERLG